MIKVYDKVSWHIDGEEDESTVINRFKIMFDFLNSKELLSEEGRELIEIGIDGSTSLHERLVTDKGKAFLDIIFDDVLEIDNSKLLLLMEDSYNKM